MDLGLLLESPLGVSPRLEWGHARVISSRAEAAVSRFSSRGSKHLWLSLEAFHEAFPRRFPTVMFHVPPSCQSILGLKVDAMPGKQASVLWTETSGVSGNGGTTLESLSPFRWRAPLLEMQRERRESFPSLRGKDPTSRARRQ